MTEKLKAQTVRLIVLNDKGIVHRTQFRTFFFEDTVAIARGWAKAGCRVRLSNVTTGEVRQTSRSGKLLVKRYVEQNSSYNGFAFGRTA